MVVAPGQGPQSFISFVVVGRGCRLSLSFERLSLSLSLYHFMTWSCQCALAITVSSCYPRRTSRVSEENKRHVVYTSTDDPIEIARTFSRLNEWAGVSVYVCMKGKSNGGGGVREVMRYRKCAGKELMAWLGGRLRLDCSISRFRCHMLHE